MGEEAEGGNLNAADLQAIIDGVTAKIQTVD